MPERMSFLKTVTESLAGPMVQMILVLTILSYYLKNPHIDAGVNFEGGMHGAIS